MPIQNFPSGLTSLLERGWVKSYPALDIIFDDDSQLNVSTVPISYGGTDYIDKLKSVGSIKTSLSRSVDRVEMVLDNADLLVGDTLLPDEDLDEILDNMKAVFYQIYVNPDDDSEIYRIEKMAGVIYSYQEDDFDKLPITLISDAYAGGGVAPFEVSPSCVFRYKDGVNCTYDGELPTCDLTFEGINGCITHFGVDMAKARFGGGAVNLSENARQTFEPIDNPPTGSGCFLPNTPIFTDLEFNEKPIKSFENAGENIVGFNRFDANQNPQTSETLDKAFVYETREWFQLTFSDGSEINGTFDHPFILPGGKRLRIIEFKEGMKFRRMVKGRGWRTVSLVSKRLQKSLIPIKFYNVPVKDLHTYYANGFPVSNRKADNPEIPV